MKNDNANNIFSLSPGFYLSLLPVFRSGTSEKIVDQLAISFLNHTSAAIQLQYRCEAGGKIIFSEEMNIRDFERMFLHHVVLDLFNEHPRFTSIIRPAVMKKGDMPAHYQTRIKIQKLFTYISRLPTMDANTPLDLKMQDAPVTRKQPPMASAAIASRRKHATAHPAADRAKRIGEVDLHLAAIAPNAKGLSNFEILSLQLKALEEALDQAIRARQQSLTIIHGVGTGKLKNEVHARLRAYAEIRFFQQEWSPRYGNGATIVFFNL